MSLYVYLDLEKLKKLPGFHVGNKNSGDLNGMPIWDVNTEPNIHLFELENQVPKVIENIVERFSFHERIPDTPHREYGVYRLGAAEAKLEPNLHNIMADYIFVRAEAKKLDDLRKLIAQIKAGMIRPNESYEKEQEGRMKNGLEQEIARLRIKLERSIAQYIALKGEFSRFALNIESSSWFPMIRRGKVRKIIHKILDQQSK